MSTFISILNWLQTNSGDLWVIFASVITVASIVVKMTPTLKDDNYLKSLIKFIGKISLGKYSPPTV